MRATGILMVPLWPTTNTTTEQEHTQATLGLTDELYDLKKMELHELCA